ncbi:regulator of chromosome condensation 1/beta-lactamase-inhibitor protein II [Armillaria fumosa]|nr:regulator of chromosome condensation 1/beta-lactamase-inhibitor protein II [Armillaria fumosa]
MAVIKTAALALGGAVFTDLIKIFGLRKPSNPCVFSEFPNNEGYKFYTATTTSAYERKSPTSPYDREDLQETHSLRSLSTIGVVSIRTSCSAAHFVATDGDGAAWLFGRNRSSRLGVRGGVDALSEEEPLRIEVKDFKWAHAACGRNHTLLVAGDGPVWTAVYAFGSGEKGQLGNGTTGERIMPGNKMAFNIIYEPVLLYYLWRKEIMQLLSGQQYWIALDEKRTIHVWGYNGYCRLRLGNHVDALHPKPVPEFTGANESILVTVGPSDSVVVDKGVMYWMTSKRENSGDRSPGSPYQGFRYMPEWETQCAMMEKVKYQQWKRRRSTC